jgi:hypothetical protein
MLLPHSILSVVTRKPELVLVVLLLLGVVLYIRGAERAKDELTRVQARAEVAEAMVGRYEAESRQLGEQVDSLRGEAGDADARYHALRQRLRNTRVPLETSVPWDTTQGGHAPDSISILDLPEVVEILDACEERVVIRDAVIRLQDLRHRTDSLIILNLRAMVAVPPQPKPQSRLSRAALGLAGGLAGAAIGQQLGGERGLAAGASVGAGIGFAWSWK